MSMALDIASLVLLVLGSFFCITAGVGLIRMPDFYTHEHTPPAFWTQWVRDLYYSA